MQAEHGFFVVTRCNRHNDDVEQVNSAPHHIRVAQGHGVESTGVNGDHWAVHKVLIWA
jgi:hypothetical protein